MRFVEEGAHVLVGDLDAAAAESAATTAAGRFPGRAVGMAVDVRDDASLDALFRRAVLEFGGVDALFYSAGAAPRFAPIGELGRDDLQQQLEVHYLGAVAAIGRAAAIMRRQGLGGAVTARLVEHALSSGIETVFLSAADDDVARVYARLGFRRCGTACFVG